MIEQRNKTAANLSKDGNGRYVQLAVLIILLMILRFIPMLFPESRMWGFNHLIFLPVEYTIIYIIGCAFVVALLFGPARDRLNRFFEISADFIFHPSRKIRWLILAVIAINLFWIFRMQVNLLGDGYQLINKISDDMPLVFKWSEVGAIKVGNFLFRLFDLAGLNGAKYSYSFLSVISGGISVLFFSLIANEMGGDNYSRLFVFLVLLFSGWILLFFGYVESYPVLWPFMTAYIFFALRFLNNKNGLFLPSAMFIISLILHLQSLFFLLSFPLLLFARGRGGRIYREHKKLVWLSMTAIAVAGLIIFLAAYEKSLGFRYFFLPLIEGRPATPRDTILSPTHLIDIFNEFFLLIPVWPVLLAATVKTPRNLVADKTSLFLLLYSLGGIFFILIVDPKLGMGRDWDLFALTGFAPMLLLLRSFAAKQEVFRKIMPGLVAVAALLLMPFICANITYQPSIDYYKWLVNLDLPKTKVGMYILNAYYKDNGDYARADSVAREYEKMNPEVERANYAIELVKKGDLSNAKRIADSLFRADPYSDRTYRLLGLVYSRMNEYDKSFEYYKKALELKPYNSSIMLELAEAYRLRRSYDEALDWLRKGLKLTPSLPRLRTSMMITLYEYGQFDSSYVYGLECLKADSTNARGNLVTGLSALALNDRINAKKYLRRFLRYSNGMESERKTVENLLLKLK